MAFVFAAFTGLLHQAFFRLISAHIWGEPLGNTASCIAQVLTCKHHRCAEVSGFVRVSEPASLRSLCFVSLWVSCMDAFAYMENVVIVFSPSPAPVAFALLALGHFQLNGACQGQPSAVGLGEHPPSAPSLFPSPGVPGGGQGIGAFFPIFFFSWYLITSSRGPEGSLVHPLSPQLQHPAAPPFLLVLWCVCLAAAPKRAVQTVQQGCSLALNPRGQV